MTNLARTLPRIGLYILFWTTLGFFAFSQSYTQTLLGSVRVPWWRLLATWTIAMYLVAITAPIVWWLARRFPFARRRWLRPLLLHLPLSVIWAVGELALSAVVLSRLNLLPEMLPSAFTGAFLVVLGTSFHGNLLLYWEILLVNAAVEYYRVYRDRERRSLLLEAQLGQTRLNALKLQLQPHFLFNTLNAIMVLVRQQHRDAAEETLARLSNLLRLVLDDVDAQEVPLRRELEYLRLYLSIEEVRFPNRLRPVIAADPAVLDAAVPHMILQPLVENAIRHGIGRRATAGVLAIQAARIDDRLEIRVEDDGPGFVAGEIEVVGGIGLANTRARLRQMYGDAGHLLLENRAQGGALVTLSIPYHAACERAGDCLQPGARMMADTPPPASSLA